MKKILLAFALIGASFTASAADGANFGKLEYNFRDYDGDARNQTGGTVVLGRQLSENVKIDGTAEFRTINGADTTSTRLEVGSTVSTVLGSKWGAYIRGSVGERFVQDDDYSYFGIEPGITYAANANWAFSTSYRYRDAFVDGTDGAETHRARVGAAYALTTNTVLTASVARNLGDVQYNEVNVGYGFKF